tara:strand:+ start:2091 stop:2471 length:381 start_codon:yes stop_codon:yes gene_type:complete
MWQRQLRHKDRAKYVGSKRTFYLIFVDILGIFLRVLLSCVVNQNVYGTKLIDCLLNRIFAERFLTDIPPQQNCFASFGLNEVLGLFGIRVLVTVNNRYFCAFLRIEYGCRATDPGIAARYQSYFAL